MPGVRPVWHPGRQSIMLMQSAGAVDDAHQLPGACLVIQVFPAGVAGFDAVDVVLRDFEVEAFD